MSSDRLRRIASLALVASLSLACGKQGDPTPRPRSIPQPANDLTVRVRGDAVLLEFSYPPATLAGLPLDGLESATVYQLVRTAPAPGQKIRVVDADLEAVGEPVLELTGADLDAAVVGSKLRVQVPLPETGNPPYGPDETPPGVTSPDDESGEEPTDPAEEASKTAETPTDGAATNIESGTSPTQALAAPGASSPAPAPVEATVEPEAAEPKPSAEPAAATTGATDAAPAAAKVVRQAVVYAVRTKALKGEESPWSNVVSVVPVPPPPAPGNLQVEGAKQGVGLTWEASAGAVGYVVLRREATDPSWGAPLGRLAADVTHYLDASALYGTRYVYTVLALAALTPPVESAPVVEREVDYRDVFAPPAPRDLRAVVVGDGVRLVWDASPDGDVDGYVIERAGADGVFTRRNAAPVSALEYTDARVPRGRVLTYRVVAVDRAGNVSPPSGTAEAHPR